MRGGGKYPVHDLTTAICMLPCTHNNTQERKRLRIFAGQDRTRVEHPIHRVTTLERGNRYIPLVVSYLQLSIIYSCWALTLHPKHIQSLQRTPITGLPVLGGTYYAVGGRRPRGSHFKVNGTFPPYLSTMSN